MSDNDLTSPLLEQHAAITSAGDSSSLRSTGQQQSTDQQNSPVTELKAQLQDLQNKLAAALAINNESSSPIAEGSGHVDVEFVKTKPTLMSKLLCKTDEKVKTILHDFTAEFPEGCVTALMGPSGAGKTTLLDFITGMLGSSVNACGQVCLPDNDAYVPQDDRLHDFYTCQQYMEHYARLSGMKKLFDCCERKKASNNVDGDNKDEEAANPLTHSTDKLIAQILDEVGLSAQKDTPVGGMFRRGLSGGQKRRLSVALEALSSPMNLFLDEPTSGLDSESALELMEYLKTYARKKNPVTGRRHRVIITIHQPSSRIWELIDNVVLLARGRLIYQGRRTLMDSFYASCGHPLPLNFNPADHYIEALSSFPVVGVSGEGVDGKSKEEMWSESFHNWKSRDKSYITFHKFAASMRASRQQTARQLKDANVVIRVDPEKSAKAMTKKVGVSAIELFRRSFTNLFRNPIILGLRLGIYGGMSVFIGMLFWRLQNQTEPHCVIVSRTALLYFILAFGSSMSVAAIPFAMVERGIVEKEVRNKRFHPVFYHTSQTLVSVPVSFILSLIVMLIVSSMTGLGGSDSMKKMISGAVLFCVFLCADAVSMFVGHVAPELVSAICIATGIFGVMTMVMGFIILPSAMPVWIHWLYYFPFMTYGFRALMNIEFKGEDVPITIPINGTEQTITIPGDQILDGFEMAGHEPTTDIGILVVWMFCMHLVSIIYLLWYKYRTKRVFVYSDN
eukprot:scaffold1311_cov140-Skeletonema_dohrnii-CCMP3373.AAC.1